MTSLAPSPEHATAPPDEAPRALPYGLHCIEADDVAAVVEALTSPMIAQGPRVAAFERAVAARVGAGEGAACSSGTAALHLALLALEVGPGDLCIVPSLTFLSTATAVRMCGAEVVFADVDPGSGLMTPQGLAEALALASGPVKVALPVHLGGRLCDMAGLAEVADAAGVMLVEDASHALGSRNAAGLIAGACQYSRASTFSFHPVKTIACGEAGMVTTNNPALAARIKRLRNHGVTREAELIQDAALSLDADGAVNPWSYEQIELGFNYRMTDVEAALGLSQLAKLDRFIAARRRSADLYDALLAPLAPIVTPVAGADDALASLHLYAIRVDWAAAGVTRAQAMRRLAAAGVGSQVHYIPVHRQPYFAARYGEMSLPGADAYYAANLSLPLFPGLTEAEARRVAGALALILPKAQTW
jgi:UDP-4-amino-4,6-dideoxy-N-acetyl-beta-L-altrosamine transaminase